MSAPDWEGFARTLLFEWPVRDVDGSELFDAALSNGLIREIPGGFDPDKHFDADGICPNPGDPWYEYAFPINRRADLPPTDAEVLAHPTVSALVEAANETVRLLWEEMGKQGNAGTHGGYIYMKLRAALAAIQEAKP